MQQDFPMMPCSQLLEVFDPEFKFVMEVPSELVVHLPPARLNITRLVFCRNYQPGEPSSCTMGDGCKFVHANVDPATLESHPIHVKYAWRHEDLCTYARLPAGETLRVTAPNNRPPVEEIPSERVLVTRGSLRYKKSDAVLSHCAHYSEHRMCNRGELCHFVHVVHVDQGANRDFKRAPIQARRSNQGSKDLLSRTITVITTPSTAVQEYPKKIVVLELPKSASSSTEASPAHDENSADSNDADACSWFHYDPYNRRGNVRMWVSREKRSFVA